MHYYKKNIGDYHKKAGRLSMLEHGAYTLLIDACYDRECFPTREDAIDWTWARTPEEISAVDFVLGRFFELRNGVYVQSRIEEEIAKYHENAETNRRIANEREEKRRLRTRSVDEQSRSVDEAPPNQEPVTNNQEPEKPIPPTPKGAGKKTSKVELPEWVNPELWAEFKKFRTRIKKPMTEYAEKLAIGKLAELMAEGQNADAVIKQSIERGWQTFYPVKSQAAFAGYPGRAPPSSVGEHNAQALQEFLSRGEQQ